MSRDTQGVRVYLLRHGEVASHRGDIPITPKAGEHAEDVGRRLAGDVSGVVTVLSGETRRARETAEHLSVGVEAAGGEVEGPTVAHALRNPDLYIAGRRVDMVSSHDALAEQVPGLEADEVGDLEFFPQFIAEKDRIGWWLRHQRPPGEDAAVVASRIRAFAASFVNPFRPDRSIVAAVTHSPLLRAVGLAELGEDIGEPEWVSGLIMHVDLSGDITTSPFSGNG